MRGAVAILFGLIVVGVGLAGLCLALMEMMTHADPEASLKAAGGLATFVVAALVMLLMAR
jgi:hypothetical protein